MCSQIVLMFRPTVRCLPLFVFFAALSGTVFAQMSGPTTAKGVTNKPLGDIDLTNEIGDVSGRRLRARLVTIEPGGQIAAHSHKGRPTLEYVVQGIVIEIRNGVEIEHGPGEMVVATNDISHWWENRSKAPVVLLPVDVFKP